MLAKLHINFLLPRTKRCYPSSYLLPEESPVTRSIGVTEATTLQKDHPAIGADVSAKEETSPCVVVAERLRVVSLNPLHHVLSVTNARHSQSNQHSTTTEPQHGWSWGIASLQQ